MLGNKNLIKQDTKTTNLFIKERRESDIDLTTLKLRNFGNKQRYHLYVVDYVTTCTKESVKSN
jgi:hypothetical protein